MTDIICSACLCFASIVSAGGPCHSCKIDIAQNDLGRMVMTMNNPKEMLVATCYEKGKKPDVSFSNKSSIPFAMKD